MKYIVKLLSGLLIPLSLSGQLTPVTNHYVLNPLTINPAYAGNRGVVNIAAFYRRQWVGIKGAPETASFTVDGLFANEKLGLGLIAITDKIGVTKETQFNTNYAYKIEMDKGVLSLGLGAGILITNTAWSDLVVLDPGDEYYLADSKVFAVPNFSFGSYYSNNKFFAGLSIPKLVGQRFDFEKNKYVLRNNFKEYVYLLNTGYLFDLSPRVKFLPSTLVALSINNKILYDLNAHFRVMDRLWLGASYRNNRSVTGMFQFQLTNQLKFAYTYDYDFNKLRTFSSGSHEVMLRFEFRYKIDAISPLNF
ncbi:MAG TPA: type IX secretion system membrane protein PorP/SprF [Bacteroidales bacterium]|nr:type IX secretion system membrane protein PorP/SprF [Bacteroidales bacterium]HQG76890.1 type IX secretion system membrane protein PorP/SprF [Bacteroidales bacterium]